MGGWAVPTYQQPAVQLPTGVAIASMGRRVGAWILDGILSGFLIIVPFVLAVATGTVSLNQQALDQIDRASSYQPFDGVTAPLFNVNAGPLWILAGLYIVLNLAYFAGSWVGWGGTPCQRALGLRVGQVGDMRKISLDAAILRWALLNGIGMVLSTAVSAQILIELSRIPTNEWLGRGSTYASSTTYVTLSGWSSLISLATIIWLIVLLISAASHSARRGLHDRFVGSIVVGPAPLVQAWPGYPPQGMPYWPGYPPQPPGYPPQPQGYPPQGMPYWPGYPQPGTPPAPPAAAPDQPPGPTDQSSGG